MYSFFFVSAFDILITVYQTYYYLFLDDEKLYPPNRPEWETADNITFNSSSMEMLAIVAKPSLTDGIGGILADDQRGITSNIDNWKCLDGAK